MYRSILNALTEWKHRKRKPLIIRGARQIGKSYIIRYFGQNYFDNYIEIDLEKEFNILDLFKGKRVTEIIKLLEIEKNVSIKPGSTLLFFDEIQSTPSLIPLLRYFYEEIPELHIIAAGSLLEFLLEEHDFSMPVGRIEYMYMGPMLFDEFLRALKKDRLLNYLQNFKLDENIPLPIHKQLIALYREYLFIGGMPEVIDDYRENNSFRNTEMIKQSILQTYQEDFIKYRKKINYILMTKIFKKLSVTVGNKVKYSNLDSGERSNSIYNVLHLFDLARIIYMVKHTSANGLPLGAEVNDKKFKNILLDVGLMLSMLNLNYNNIEYLKDAELINSGNISEQFVGQHLLYSLEYFYKPELYYWTREKVNSSAEIDYVISEKGKIIPIEVKAGKTGSLKSLHRFIEEKKVNIAVRINNDIPSIMDVKNSLTTGEKIQFKLISIPTYLICELRRLVREEINHISMR